MFFLFQLGRSVCFFVPSAPNIRVGLITCLFVRFKFNTNTFRIQISIYIQFFSNWILLKFDSFQSGVHFFKSDFDQILHSFNVRYGYIFDPKNVHLTGWKKQLDISKWSDVLMDDYKRIHSKMTFYDVSFNSNAIIQAATEQ